MKNAKLSFELQEEIRDYFLKVQGTMAQQDELDNFFDQLSAPLRIAVQKEIFSAILREQNQTIAETIREIISETNAAENQSRHNALGLNGNQVQFINERMDNFLPSIAERMSSRLLPPHRYVVEQG